MPKVAVVGAGVIGLSAAVCIQKELPDCQVTVISEHVYPNITSAGPPGLFRPYNITSDIPADAGKWIEASWKHYAELSVSDHAAQTGIFPLSGYILSSDDPDLPAAAQYRDLVPNFRQLSGAELDRHGGPWRYGSFHSTLIVEPSLYLRYLTKQFLEKGGTLDNLSLLHLSGLSEHDYDVVVNCSGLGARALVEDETVIPVRGQLVRVDAPWVKEFYMAESSTYIYPNRETIVLGGTRQPEDWETAVRPEETVAIKKHCCAVVPSLQDAHIVEEWAGLRPWRPSIRLENDSLPLESDRSLEVVHNYGHGGNGISLAWGCAVHATRLVQELLAVKDL
ncbi:D-aspartate oxidase-like [Paramacrobiotus metropolitanus]|uniref:D-aspartate oxidase-like n=1 Tax=Paramacrobiotus metropolitanus TaxID=2943436 RepID=UPI002445DB81|nr:D-aspartate oxidase-like [Paramacrobiotus metropolitanus]